MIFRTLAFSLIVGPAFGLIAQDFFNGGVTAQTAARAGIYTPSSDNALDALSVNPAGLSFLSGRVLNLSAVGLLARGSFTNVANRNSPMRFTGGALPLGAVGLPVGKRWTVGFGAMPDLLSSSKWQFHDAPGVAGADCGAQHETSKIVAFRGTGGVSYRVSSILSVGASVSAIYNSNTLMMPYVFQSNPDLKGLKTLLDLNTSGIGWNAGFGTVVTPNRQWQFGAAYRTRSNIVSSGTATGNLGAQFAALNIPFVPTFRYRAHVTVELPQSATFSLAWRRNPLLRFSLESTWTNWNRSFGNLPVMLTEGTNSEINHFLGSSGINDTIPLKWKDQYSVRASVERQLGESFSLTGGYIHQNNPVPSSTLSPLTAAILSNGLTGGASYVSGRRRFDAAYRIDLTNRQNVGTSALLSGEFGQSITKIGTQGLTLSYSYRL